MGTRFKYHYIRGHAKVKACTTLATVVVMAMAFVYVRAGRQQQMRSLVKPVAVLRMALA